jgi:hypothetical protein
LARLFAAVRLHINFFQPSFKLKEKRREGAKLTMTRQCHANKLWRIRPSMRQSSVGFVRCTVRARPARRSACRNDNCSCSDRQSDTAAFAGRLGDDWKKGEQRAIHRRPYVRRKPVTPRPSMLDPYVPLIEEWLATAPHLSAVDILVPLEKQVPDRFSKGQLRTVQRLVKRWRAKAAHQLINSAEVMIRIEPSIASTLATPASEPAQQLSLLQREAGMAAAT